jgi:hypothetical protein
VKIKQEDYNHLETELNKFLRANKTKCSAYKKTVSEKRFAWDMLKAADLLTWSCDVLYKYLNDAHIETAVIKIIKGSKEISSTQVIRKIIVRIS